MYENLIRVANGVADHYPIPQEIYGFLPETYLDLTFLSEDYFPEYRLWVWWPEEVVIEALGKDKKYDDEVLTPDFERKVVVVTFPQIDMTPADIKARDDAIKLERHRRIEWRRQQEDPQHFSFKGFDFDLDSRIKYLVTDMRGEAEHNSSYTSVIKDKNSIWLELTNSDIFELASLVRDLHDNVYSRQKELDEAVEDWTYTEEMLEQGWPSSTI